MTRTLLLLDSVVLNDLFNALDNDIFHIVQVGLVPQKGETNIKGTGEHGRRLGQVLIQGTELPIDKVARILGVSKEFHRQIVTQTFLAKGFQHGRGKLQQLELERIVDSRGSW